MCENHVRDLSRFQVRSAVSGEKYVAAQLLKIFHHEPFGVPFCLFPRVVVFVFVGDLTVVEFGIKRRWVPGLGLLCPTEPEYRNPILD